MKQIISRYTPLFLAVFAVSVFSSTVVAQNQESTQGIDQIKSEISSKTISLNLKETAFREVINLIRQRVSFNIIIDDSVEKMFKGGQGGAAGQGGNQPGAGGGDGFGGGNNSGNNSGGGFGSSGGDDSGGGFGSSGGDSNSGGGFGSSDGGNSGGGFGNSDGGNSGGGFGSSGGNNNSGGGFGSSGGDSGGGFGSSGGDSGGGFGSSGNSGGGFGSSGGSSGGGFGSGNAAGGGAGASGPQPVDKNVTISLDNISIERALKIILSMKNLTAIFKNGVVHIVPETDAKQFDIRFYDVRDVQYELKDFEAPQLQFTGQSKSSSGGGSEQKMVGTSLYKEGNGGGKDIITNEKEFMKLIEQNVGDAQDWKQGKASMRMTSGILVVNQTPEVHEEISFLINRLRQFK